jgi:hypothetical protein
MISAPRLYSSSSSGQGLRSRCQCCCYSHSVRGGWCCDGCSRCRCCSAEEGDGGGCSSQQEACVARSAAVGAGWRTGVARRAGCRNWVGARVTAEVLLVRLLLPRLLILGCCWACRHCLGGHDLLHWILIYCWRSVMSDITFIRFVGKRCDQKAWGSWQRSLFSHHLLGVLLVLGQLLGPALNAAGTHQRVRRVPKEGRMVSIGRLRQVLF